MKRAALACTALVALTLPAVAADPPVPVEPVVEPVVEPLPVGWDGFYLGGHAGYGSGNRSGEFSALFTTDDFDYDQDGWIAGGQIGYNRTFGSILLGVEVDASFGDISGTGDFGGFPGTGSYNWLATAKARAGYATDQFLIYATGGLALAGFDFDGSSGCSFSQARQGYVVGGGGEMKISDRASIKAEYNYIDFQDIDPFQTCASFGFLPTIVETDADMQVIKVGFNYLLGADRDDESVTATYGAGPSSWGGFYLGGHAGYGWANRDGYFDVFGPVPFDYDQDGALIGAQGGYNYMIGNFLLGAEVEASLAAIEGFLDLGFPIAGNGEWTWMAAAKARAGYAMDDIMVFATGGVALAGFDFDSTVGCEFDQTRTGYLLGGGAEFKMSRRVSFKAEYNYVNFGDGPLQKCSSFVVLPTVSEADADAHIVKFAFNYLLGVQ